MHKPSLSNLSLQQLSECTAALSLPAIPEDHLLRVVTGVIFAIEPRDTTVEMFNTIGLLLCKEWNKRYLFIKEQLTPSIGGTK